jgi:mRNA interferase MazF
MPKQRDIVLIAVPYADLSAAKRRPVLILSSDMHFRQSPDMLVATITSNLNIGMFGIVIDTADMEVGLLPVRSLIRADKIHNLSQREIIKPYGRLSPAAFEDVLQALDLVLGR